MSQDTEEPDGFIHPPDELNDSEENGLVCFMDTARPCGADCMAYLTIKPIITDLPNQAANCQLLVNAHRVGKHVVILAQLVNRFTEGAEKTAARAKTAAADEARANQTPPQPPMGPTTVVPT